MLWMVEKGPELSFVEANSPKEAAMAKISDEDVTKPGGVSIRVNPAFMEGRVVIPNEPDLRVYGEGWIEKVDSEGWCKVVWKDKSQRWIPSSRLTPLW